MWSNDPIRDFEDFDADCARTEEEYSDLPRCACCDEPILTDRALFIERKWYCEDCEDEARDNWWEKFRDDHLCEI